MSEQDTPPGGAVPDTAVVDTLVPDLQAIPLEQLSSFNARI